MSIDIAPPPAVIELIKDVKDKHSIKFEGKWNGYDVYLLSFPEYEVGEWGLPTFILFKNNKARLATDEETTLKIMPELY